MTSISRRVELVSTRIAPAPDPGFLAYARAVVVWGTGTPNEAAAAALARWLAGPRTRCGGG